MPRSFTPRDNYASSRRNNRRDYAPSRRPRAFSDEEYETYTSAPSSYEDDTYTSARPSSNYYDDSNYEDYGEIGSNYDITSEPDYEEYEAENYAPERKAPSRLDFSEAQPSRSTRNPTPSRYGTAPDRLDFGGNDDLSKYMEYLDRYDSGDIDNHDMSRVQRRFANSPFWDTFRPSRDMIRKYGSGDKSTCWPMFENKNGKWKPIIWRND